MSKHSRENKLEKKYIIKNLFSCFHFWLRQFNLFDKNLSFLLFCEFLQFQTCTFAFALHNIKRNKKKKKWQKKNRLLPKDLPLDYSK